MLDMETPPLGDHIIAARGGDPIRPAANRGHISHDNGGLPGGYGYVPSWKFIRPPGVGDAPQHVYNTAALLSFSILGAGDAPISTLYSLQAPIVKNQAVTVSGYAYNGGGFALSPLWAPEPLVNPAQNQFAASGF